MQKKISFGVGFTYINDPYLVAPLLDTFGIVLDEYLTTFTKRTADIRLAKCVYMRSMLYVCVCMDWGVPVLCGS